jgi:hypothetical protein
VVPFHYRYDLHNGVSFVLGTGLYAAQPWLGLHLPGSIPLIPWSPETPARLQVSAVYGLESDQAGALAAGYTFKR